MIKRPTITTAILAINSKANFKVESENIDTLEFINDTTPISNEDIEAKLAELETQYTNEKYARDRKEAYEEKSWQEQMDMQYWDSINNTTFWTDWVKSVKDKFPKE